jgi:phosphate transport system substrate-binding protein
VKNQDGTYVAPTLDGASAALAGAAVNPDLTYNPLNAPGTKAYPITAPTWILVYKLQTDAAKAKVLKAFLTFVLDDGQKRANAVDYARLPDSIRTKAVAQITQIGRA